MKLDDLVSGEQTCRCFGLLLARIVRTVLAREEFVVSGGSSWSRGVMKGLLALWFRDPVLRSSVGIKTLCPSVPFPAFFVSRLVCRYYSKRRNISIPTSSRSVTSAH